MSEETESISSLLAKREYARALPLLERDLEKYPNNVRIRLQYADALAGAGSVGDAIRQYEETASFYDDNGLVVQAVAVRKKAEKLRGDQSSAADETHEPAFSTPAPPSPLLEDLTDEDRAAVIGEMVLENFNEGDIVITEGEEGSSLYIVVSGEVKVYTRGKRGENVFLARLTEGDFFGEVSVLTGKPRTATITASQRSELLRLDKDKLDRLVQKQPRIRQILDQFYRRRASHTVEAMIENLKSTRKH